MFRLFSACLAALLLLGSARAAELRVELLDVGQGDAILVRSPAGKTILIDAGEGKTDVVPMLVARGVKQIDLLVATHPHADHIGGMDEVVAAVPVKLYTDNGLPHTTQTYERLMSTVEAKGVAYRGALTGQTYNLDDGATLEVLFPRGDPLKNTRSDLNSNSVVVRLRHQGHCFLFTGDAEEPTERALLDAGLGPCDVLKVAHHGSDHSTTRALLEAVKPRFGLISVGVGNRYDHPGPDTLARLQSAGVEVRRTDLEGTITVVSSEKGLRVTGERAAPGVTTSSAAVAPTAAAPVAAVPAAAPAAAPASVPTGTAPPPKPSACPYEGSSGSEVFHEAGCGNAAKIGPANHVCYASREAALAAGKRPAGCCKP